MDGRIMKKYKMHSLLPFRSLVNKKKLLLAATVSNIDELKRILNVKEIDPNCKDPENNEQSPLHAAAKNGRLDAVIQLLKYGANPNAVDFDGNTPLHSALLSVNNCVTDMQSVILTLVNYGASAHAINKLGQSPVDCAKRSFYLIEQLSDCYPEKSLMLNTMAKVMDLLLRAYMDQESTNDVKSITQKLEHLCANERDNRDIDPVKNLTGEVSQLALTKSCEYPNVSPLS